jgi:hypothetical protein
MKITARADLKTRFVGHGSLERSDYWAVEENIFGINAFDYKTLIVFRECRWQTCEHDHKNRPTTIWAKLTKHN